MPQVLGATETLLDETNSTELRARIDVLRGTRPHDDYARSIFGGCGLTSVRADLLPQSSLH